MTALSAFGIFIPRAVLPQRARRANHLFRLKNSISRQQFPARPVVLSGGNRGVHPFEQFEFTRRRVSCRSAASRTVASLRRLAPSFPHFSPEFPSASFV